MANRLVADTVPGRTLVLNGPELVDMVSARGPEEVGLSELWPDEVDGIDVTGTPDETVRLERCCTSVV